MVKNGNWWKFSGVIIFLYVLIGGMTTPLRPGITNITPSNGKSGDSVTLDIFGYNTHFSKAGDTRVWLKLDSVHALAGQVSAVINDNKIKASFVFPNHIPDAKEVHNLSLILDNSLDGPFVQPNAFFLSSRDSMPPLAANAWKEHALGNFHAYSGIQFPYRNILNETIRNTFFHVALWFAMFLLLILGVYHSIKYLRTGIFDHDQKASYFTYTAILYGVLGILTGAFWAKHTWDAYWTNDVKLNMTAIALCIYFAYVILRGMNPDQDRRARMAASYNIFAFLALIPLVFVIPRLTDSLHPGNGGNPALGGEDLDHTLRLFFYPSIVALFLIGLWISELGYRFEKLKDKVYLQNHHSKSNES